MVWNLDLNYKLGLLRGFLGVISSGEDECWSLGLRRGVKGVREGRKLPLGMRMRSKTLFANLDLLATSVVAGECVLDLFLGFDFSFLNIAVRLFIQS